MSEFNLPALGADMDAGAVAEWKVKPGDTVHRGDVVAVVDTDKGAIDVEYFGEGTVEALLVEPGVRLPVGTPILRIRAPGEPLTAAPPPAATPVSPPAAAASREEVHAGTEAPPRPSAHVRAAPATRKLAAEWGLDLAAITGTGEGGAVTREDVERYREESAIGDAVHRGEGAALTGEAVRRREGAARTEGDPMRRAIAAAMSRSKREIPHYYLADWIDATPALAWLEAENARRGLAERVLPAALFLKATADAAHEVPEMNGYWQNDGFKPGANVHLGVAVALRTGGLVNPAIHNAETLALTQLMAELREVLQKARSGRLTSSSLGTATLTVTNLGDLGVESVYGIIYPPQVALVGFGAVVERPWVVDGQVVARKLVRVTLAADHRASDGRKGAVFLESIKRRLAAPAGYAKGAPS